MDQNLQTNTKFQSFSSQIENHCDCDQERLRCSSSVLPTVFSYWPLHPERILLWWSHQLCLAWCWTWRNWWGQLWRRRYVTKERNAVFLATSAIKDWTIYFATYSWCLKIIECLVQHCERSESCLHFTLKMPKFNLASFENLKLAVKQCYQKGQF